MVFTLSFLPFIIVDIGEKAVGIKFLMNNGKINSIGKMNRLFVYLRAAQNKYFFLACTQRQSIGNGFNNLTTLNSNILAGDDNITAVGQRLT
jgi:hypothetical protein